MRKGTVKTKRKRIKLSPKNPKNLKSQKFQKSQKVSKVSKVSKVKKEDSLTVGHKKQKTETVCLEQAHAVENATSTIVSEIVQNKDGTIHTNKTEVKQTTIITDTLRWSQTITHSEEYCITRRKNEIEAEQSSEHEFPLGKLEYLIDNIREGDYETKSIAPVQLGDNEFDNMLALLDQTVAQGAIPPECFSMENQTKTTTSMQRLDSDA